VLDLLEHVLDLPVLHLLGQDAAGIGDVEGCLLRVRPCRRLHEDVAAHAVRPDDGVDLDAFLLGVRHHEIHHLVFPVGRCPQGEDGECLACWLCFHAGKEFSAI